MPYGDQNPAPIAEPLPREEQTKITLPDDPWSDRRALAIVRADFAYAESYRTHAHDWRYRNADELYLAWSGQKYWDGTRVPRSSLGQYVVFQQIQAMLPKVVPVVTSYDNQHFYLDGGGGGAEGDLYVEAWKELVQRQLVDTKFREQVRRACHAIKQYGNGVLEVGVEEVEDEYVIFDRKVVPMNHRLMIHPVAGIIPFPTKVDERFTRKIVKEKRTRPYIRYVSVKDFYVDPSFEGTVLQDAGYVIKRVYLRAQHIKMLKGQPGFKIPGDEYLKQISFSKATANQDVTKQTAELYRYTMWNPAQDYTSDPALKKIAVIERTSKDRKIWYLPGAPSEDESSIIYNQPNKYNEINYFSAQYADVLDRWHALAVSDVTEGEQRLQQSVINARIDELALDIHRPRAKRRGITIPSWQLKRRPGVVWEVENPESDIKEFPTSNITQQAYIEVDASNVRASKITGMSDLSAFGTGTPGGNSANRSATGINVQAGASDSRIMYLVGTIEDLLVEPVINAVIRYNRKFLDMKQASNWLKNDSRFSQLDALKVMNARVVAECRGSIRMNARQGFLQTFPVLAQTLLNPEVLQILAQQQQMTINVKELVRRVDDAINYSGRDALFIPMTKGQIQAMQQPPAEAVMKTQLQQAQLQSAESINDKRLIAKLSETLLKVLMGAHTDHAKMDDEYVLGLLDKHLQAKQIEAAANGGAEEDAGDRGGAGPDS
jgi:hypothetical protein